MLIKIRLKSGLRILALRLCFNLFVIFILFEERPSAMLFLKYSCLDSFFLDTALIYVGLNLFLLKLGAHSLFYIISKLGRITHPCFCNFELKAFWIFSLLLLMSSDVHPNPGPSPSGDKNFSSGFLSFCNWNLNTLSKDNFYRVTLLEAHNSIFKYDIISLCETSLNNEVVVPENSLPGYIFHPLNNPDGSRNGGVGIFYRETLPLRVREDLSFDECLVTELIIRSQKNILFRILPKSQT